MSGSSEWIGRTRQASETIGERQLAQFRIALGALLVKETVPPGFHWCLLPDLAASRDLGRDGHPRLGIFLPDLGLARRMWAGGEIRFLAPLLPGDMVLRKTTIVDVSFKTGSTGQLAFVTLEHRYSVGGQLHIEERQDIVYREEPKAIAAIPKPSEDWPGARSRLLMTDAVLLFRYSALTFNGHRIHYDFPYATAVEGYGGLVVHGPLQATAMLNLAAEILGRMPALFRYRGLSPLICGEAAVIEARENDEGLALRVRRADGVATMEASTSP
jgi:3-methylfumaryl-CoA hydratase